MLILFRLLPLLALSGTRVRAGPLVRRQEASASASDLSSPSVISSDVAGATATATSAGSVAASASSSVLPSDGSSPSPSGTSSVQLPPPSVTMYPATSNGEPVIVDGERSQLVPMDSYLGIPFAEPPVGDLRFVPPQDAVYPNSTFEATSHPPACLQSPNEISGSNYSEDCLYLNVFTPAGANAQTAWLPVMVWIHGGSFTAGGAEVYDGSGIIATSSLAEKPVILVVLQYRLGILGFGYGDEIAENGAANLGLRDQLKALEWVQQNIWAWGGDPDRVTVFGQSAGAISISLLYLQQDISLFRGAIMQSGAQSTAPIGPTSSSWQEPLDLILSLLGCSPSSSSESNSTSNGTELTGFACLKAAPADELVAAQEQVLNLTNGAFIFAPSIDYDLIPDSPHRLLEQGQFARIPFISGSVKDEGTLFTPEAVNNETAIAALLTALSPSGPPPDILAQAISLYPSDAAAGSPFDTGNETFGLAPAWKQAAAIIGDAQFQAQRRWFLAQANNYGLDQSWSYQFEQMPSVGDTPERLGVYHAADVLFTFGAPVLGIGGNWSEADQGLSAQMLDYWTSFANYLDPNEGTVLPNSTYWTPYGSASEEEGGRNMLRLLGGEGNVTVFADTYRPQMEYFLTEPEAFNQRKRSARSRGGEAL